MSPVVKLLIVLAVVAFLAAVVVTFTGAVLGVTAEGFSRATTNLALIAIALAVSDGGGTEAA